MTKPPTSYRLTEYARALVEKLAAKMGISQTAVIETAIRELAERKKIS